MSLSYRLAFVTLLAAALGAGGGCKERQSLKVDALKSAAVGELVRFEGTLALRGSQPFPMLVLELDDESTVRIESKTIQRELESLASMNVSVEGDVMPPIDKMPVINVTRYDMLRLSSGELPVVGVVSIVGDNTILTERNGTTHWIRGTLLPIIRDYSGARIWVIGALGDETAPGEPRGAKSYWVTGYGVLSDAE
jgi:hypothetical protein